MQTMEKILVIDDSKANLEIINEILEDDFIVETALDGQEGLEKARAFQPGIVLLDIMMPGIDGYEVCEKMREDLELDETKIILVSAKGKVQDRLKGYEVGADDYIMKPFDKNELLAKTMVFSRLNAAERKSKQLNRLLLMRQQDIPNVLWECDPKLNLTFIDDSIIKLLGFAPDEVLGKPISDLLKKGKKEFKAFFKRLSSENPSIKGIPFSFKKKGKGAITLQVFADVILDHENNISGMGGILRDMNDFVQLLDCDSGDCGQLKLQIDSNFNIILPEDEEHPLHQYLSNESGPVSITTHLRDESVVSMLQFAFDQKESVPFPIEISLPDESMEIKPFTVELQYSDENVPCLEGNLIPSSAKDQLQMVSKRIENQSQRIKDQEESLKNAIVMDSETKLHIQKDAANLAAEILNLLKSLTAFAFDDDGIFNLEEYQQFVTYKNLQDYSENLRLLGNKLHGLKGSCGFLHAQSKELCHRVEELTKPLAELDLILTKSLIDLIKQFVFDIEEVLEALEADKEYDLNLDEWFARIDRAFEKGKSFLGQHAAEVAKMIRERSIDQGEIRKRKKEDYISVSLDGYESLSEKIKELYYSFTSSLNNEQMVQAGSMFNQLLSTHQEIKKVPLVLTRYERLIPKLAKDYGKEADFLFNNHQVKADREFWDSIHEILNHMLKNAVIHGIEPLEQRKEAGKTPLGSIGVDLNEDALHILLTVSDDGKGIDANEIKSTVLEKGIATQEQINSMTDSEVLDLLFLQGVSTAKQLDDNAGRGVGMNAVKEVMQQLQGECTIESKPGEGTKWNFSFLKNNVSLACIIMAVGEQALAFPEDYVETFLDYDESNRQTVKQAPTYEYNGSLIPLIDSETLFSCDSSDINSRHRSVVVLKNKEERRALVINRIIHHAVQPILPLPKVYRNVPIYQGITIHNNDPVQVVNIEKLF